ncbi:5'-methylthioadenosine/S-adenosylhomocysteine nucleosidase [Enterococcus sp. 3H8_DIV0648]|uniref:5'-methylthioadenosine/S-adenosylhomocysteine nucleosidase n=1 Tax=Enterococcus sp. 3H8_DIV0648 TaxID=1834178 RepID=UPI000B5A9E63|nr:5'-methylthioadenosine/S-adenosylhomocysteine nucleosidase [Enterococcus sp. 3H8_DIV0648]OTO15138.1 MTA/SAH nucleosidase [Enterococcus sp. 3H8_DIV0648]
MKIGIVSAMDLEIQPLIDRLALVQKFEYLGRKFYVSNQGLHQFILLCSGQGKTNSSIFTQVLLEKFSPELVLNIGICGGISSNSSLSDIYLGKKYCHYDIRKKQSQLKFPYKLFYEADKDAIHSFSKHDPSLKIGTFGTGEGFVTTSEQRTSLINDFHVDCVDMESASIAQCCFLNKISFLSIRIVSDKANSQAANIGEMEQKKLMSKIFDLICLIYKIE